MEEVSKLFIELIHSPLLYLTTVIIFIIMVFTGKLKIHSKGFHLDNGESERKIIRAQMEYARNFCDGLIIHLPNDINRYRQKYIIEMVYNEIIRMISFNHIMDDEIYIKLEIDKIWNIVSSTTDTEEYKGEAMKVVIQEETPNLIRALLKVRKLMS